MSEAVSTGLLDRAIRRITEVWRDMASSVSGEPDETLEIQMQACLAGRGGEVSARNRAAKLAQTYLTQDVPQFMREKFNASTQAHSMAIAGLSEGGTCAVTLALNNPAEYDTFASYSGFADPTYQTDDRRQTGRA